MSTATITLKASPIHYAFCESSLGSVLVAVTEKGICAITLGDGREFLLKDLQRRFAKTEIVPTDKYTDSYIAKVIELIERPEAGFDAPLDVRGTAFQQSVWQALRTIPLGKTASYAEIARAIGMPKATRAVAQACGANHIAVVIPCHRVVRTDGALSGYRWGVERKATLLERERKI
jgi:AraC family transcriptional regulator of adaptative response/methylated-DNA-[protein]-cysteine methyltransferase